MAKKVVATLQQGNSKKYTRVIKMVKTDRGSYNFKEGVIHNETITDFLKN
jgi:hypothetical protein